MSKEKTLKFYSFVKNKHYDPLLIKSNDFYTINNLSIKQQIKSPISGKIKLISLDENTLVIRSKNKNDFYIYINFNNLTLNKESLVFFTKIGQKIKKGQKIFEADFSKKSAFNNLNYVTLFINNKFENCIQSFQIIENQELNIMKNLIEEIKK